MSDKVIGESKVPQCLSASPKARRWLSGRRVEATEASHPHRVTLTHRFPSGVSVLGNCSGTGSLGGHRPVCSPFPFLAKEMCHIHTIFLFQAFPGPWWPWVPITNTLQTVLRWCWWGTTSRPTLPALEFPYLLHIYIPGFSRAKVWPVPLILYYLNTSTAWPDVGYVYSNPAVYSSNPESNWGGLRPTRSQSFFWI